MVALSGDGLKCNTGFSGKNEVNSGAATSSLLSTYTFMSVTFSLPQ